jgi:hypothetical protein
MSGYAKYNRPLFNRVAGQLRAQGHEVFNPAENEDGGTIQSRAFYMRLDIPALMESEGIVVLPGWHKSRGACLEVWLAIDLDMPVFRCSEANGTITLEPAEGLTPHPLPFGGER